jgi:NADH dehydrogenase FAD-containing subunit
VKLVLGNRASVDKLSNGKYEVHLADGTTLTADVVLNTTTKGSATTGFLPAECLNDEQEIKITSHLQFQSGVPNAASHFAVGDVVEWSGIKRAGGAMVMGQLAASNIYASIINSEDSNSNLPLADLPVYENVIGLAVGKQCLTYDKKNGVKWGVQLMKDYFQDDLGWAANLKYLRLTDVEEQVVEEPSKLKVHQLAVEPVSAAA